MAKAVNSGDVFAAKLPDGRYKVVRVLRKVQKSSLLCTSEYLDSAFPELTDPLLRTTVIQNRFSFRNKPATTWVTGKPPASFEFIGNFPLTEHEAATECNTYSGGWDESSGNEAYMEWRWLHEREAFQEEVRRQYAEMERRRKLAQKPKKMMPEEEFWPIIELLDWQRQGNDEEVLAPAIKALAAKTKPQIRAFAERFAFLLYQLDTKAHASHIGQYSYDPKTNYVSADGFLYARCVVIANGPSFYAQVLNDPTAMPKDLEFESLLTLAPAAYEMKTGEEFDYSTGCSFETFSNPLGWQEGKTAAE
jgi:hypothetical protein